MNNSFVYVSYITMLVSDTEGNAFGIGKADLQV